MVGQRRSVARLQRYAAELRLIQCPRVARLLDVPIADARMRGGLRREGFDLLPPQAAPRSTGESREETPYPADAAGNVLFLRARFAQDRLTAHRPRGVGIIRSRHLRVVLGHGRETSAIPPAIFEAHYNVRQK